MVIPVKLATSGDTSQQQRLLCAQWKRTGGGAQVTRSPVFSHFAESLAGMDTIRAYGYQDRFAVMSDDRVDYNHR